MLSTNKAMEHELLLEMSRLLEKTGMENVLPPDDSSGDRELRMAAVLMALKGMNARYDKGDAISQIQWLMETYNVQIDELIERIRS